jgi:hypothetical protein
LRPGNGDGRGGAFGDAVLADDGGADRPDDDVAPLPLPGSMAIA